VREVQTTAQALGVQLQILEVRGPDEFESAFAGMAREHAEALLIYEPSLPDLFRRAAYYVDRILKGAKPGDRGGAIPQPGACSSVAPLANFLALDARTGEELWRFQTGFGANAPSMTYEADGEQYVAITAGCNQSVGGAVVAAPRPRPWLVPPAR
jgi:hypothetical protein